MTKVLTLEELKKDAQGIQKTIERYEGALGYILDNIKKLEKKEEEDAGKGDNTKTE